MNYKRTEFLDVIRDIDIILNELKPEVESDLPRSDKVAFYYKIKLMHARTLNRIKDYVKAEEICDEIHKFVTDKLEDGAK
jgi:hypothetical protein